MATIKGDLTKQSTDDNDLFLCKMQQNVIINKFNREYALLDTIQPGVAIEFTIKSAIDLYLDLKHSCLHVFVKITKADRRNFDANTAAIINLTLHSMFREIGLEFYGRNAVDTSQLSPDCSNLETFLNFSKEIQNNSSPERRLDNGH